MKSLSTLQQRSRKGKAPKDSTAFTLVELLLIVAMVAIGAAMLLPALAATRPVTHSYQCMNNLKQLTAAWKMYSSDFNDALLSSADGIAGRTAWMRGHLDFSSSAGNWDISVYVTTSPIWPYTGANSNLFRCPADRSTVVVSGARKPRVRSYSMNHAFGMGEWLDQTYNSAQTVWRTYAKGAEIVIPGKTFLFLDEHPDSMNDGQLANACTGADSPATARIIDFPGSSHANGVCSLSFTDGSSQVHKWLSARMKPPIRYDNNLPLNVQALDAWPDVQWLAGNTTVRR